MGATLKHFVDHAHGQAGCLQRRSSTARRDHIEPPGYEVPSHPDRTGLVDIADADEYRARGRRRGSRTELGFGEGLFESIAGAHHFAGGLHLRTQDRVYAGELVEGHHRLLDAEKGRNHFAGESLLGQRLAGHATCGDLGKGDTDALGDKRHRARGPGIHLNDVDLVILPGELHIHQALDLQGTSHLLDLLAHGILHRFVEAVGRQGAGRIARVHTRLLDMLHDGTDHHLLAVTHGVDIHFDSRVEEVVQQHRRIVGGAHRFGKIAQQLALLIDNLHGPPAQHIRGSDDERVFQPLGRGEGLLGAADRHVGRLHQTQFFDHLLEALPVLRLVDGVR